MKSAEIRRELDKDPNAVFALKPGPFDQQVCLVRGLVDAGGGQWSYTELRTSAGEGWRKPDLKTYPIRCRELTSRRAAEAEVARRLDAEQVRVAKRIQAGELVARLRETGVDARAGCGGVVITDLDALESYLERKG